MAVLTLFTPTFNRSNSCTPLNFFTSLQNLCGDSQSNLKAKGRINRVYCRKIRVVSSHSNPKILKRNRKSRYGQPVSPYDSEEDVDDEDSVGDEDDGDDDWISDDEFADVKISEADRQQLKMQNSTKMKQGSCRHLKRVGGASSSNSGQNLKTSQHKLGINNGKDILKKRESGISYDTSRQSASIGSLGDIREKEAESSSKNRFSHLSEELDLDERWFPLLDYLSTFGLKESHFIQMYERHMPSLQINVDSAEERLGYLLSVGVKHRDIRKIILRQPQILGYTVENNLKSHVAFLGSLGIPESRIGKIITATPSLFSYSIDNSLRPTVKYLLEEIGIKTADLSKVVQLSPQILVQRIDNTWNIRYNFLRKELGAPRESIVKMVTKHPQILHYSIEDGLRPRINFLRSIGMRNSDILKVSTSLTQWAGTSLDTYLDFRKRLLLKEFAKKYERQ